VPCALWRRLRPRLTNPCLAHARSGDKGNDSNIAIFSRKPEYTAHLGHVLTEERMASHYREWAKGTVVRHEVPGLHAFNFVLAEAPGGGGMASHAVDPQGKSHGQRALEMTIPMPRSWGVE
jgi:hypothetical protein